MCVEVPNNLTGLKDYSPRPQGDLGEDYGRGDQRLAVPGLLLRARDMNATTLWGWAPADVEGCTAPFDAPAGAVVDVEAYLWSTSEAMAVNIISLSCADSDTNDCVSESQFRQFQIPQNGGKLYAVLPGTRIAYAHYAASYAESRSHLWPNQTYYTRTSAGLATISDRRAGGYPTANYGNETWKRKFTLAHEFGHLQTVIVPIPALADTDLDFCYLDPGCTNSHTPDSQEWHSAAAIEGFADFYSMQTWNDVAEYPNGVMSYQSPDDSEWSCRYTPYLDYPVPTECAANSADFPAVASSWSYAGHCSPETCPAGVALQSDWAFALWDIYGGQPGVTLTDLIGILQLSHPWPPNGEDQDYWDNFINVAVINLDTNELSAWFGAAELRGIDH